ncbi:MAG: pyruvate kinase [Ruminococcaceae bacterium]|nr:pyruvate kinase [Oscillospiraceae bacterium]
MRKTKIICTLGPSVDSDDMLLALIENGMDCARLNFSHGSHAEQKSRIDRLKKLREKTGRHIPILLDTKGPEIRVLRFEEGKTIVKQDGTFTFFGDGRKGTAEGIGLTYGSFAEHMQPGVRILADDGNLAFTVERIEGDNVICRVDAGGVLKDRKSLNIPGYDLPMPFLSETDRRDILFGIEQDVDFVAASFVRSGEDVKSLRAFLDENGGKSIRIISKIESVSGVENIDEIIALSDGIMVARGDLGVEISFKKLPDIQKRIILKCFRAGKHCITATQMLESMTHSFRPTRAEVSDVANAIYDGTTAIMLSGETAAGEHPIEAVRTMSAIAAYAEETIDYKDFLADFDVSITPNIPNTVAMSAAKAAHYLDTAAILVATRSGHTAELVSCFRPACPIVAATVDEKALRQLHLAWGVYPVKAVEQPSFPALYEHTLSLAVDSQLVKSGDSVVVVSGSNLQDGFTSMMTLHVIR